MNKPKKDTWWFFPSSSSNLSQTQRTNGLIFSTIIVAAILVGGAYLWKNFRPSSPSKVALAKLVRTLHLDEDVFSRAAAARALGKSGELNVIPDLLEAYKTDQEIRAEIINALADLGVTSNYLVRLMGQRPIYEKIIIEIQKIDFRRYLILTLSWDVIIGTVAYFLGTVFSEGPSLFARPKLGIVVVAMATSISFVLWVYYVPQIPKTIEIDRETFDEIQVDLAAETNDIDAVPLLLEIISDTARPMDLRIKAVTTLGRMRNLGRWEAQVIKSLIDFNVDSVDSEEFKIAVIWALGNLVADPSKRENDFEYREFVVGALSDYQVALQYDPNNPHILLRRGVLNLTAGNYSAAINDFSEAIILQPGFPEALYQRGQAYMRINSYIEAISDFSAAINYGMEKSDIFCARGNANFLIEEYPASIDDFKQCIDKDKGRADAYRTLGLAYKFEHKNSEALSAFEMYLKLVPAATDKKQIEQWINELRK